MGKKQHQKDKLYLTTTEWKEIGGHKDDTGARLQRAQFKRLPLTHCALSLIPFDDPVCTRTGEIFDLTHIIPYLKKNGVNPCTGKKMTSKDLIHLKFDKDEQGKFRCPVTFRSFTDHTHVVAIATTGNVFSYEAVQELNLKANHLKDLLNDKPFSRSDIIVLQDPNHLEKFNMEKFYHVQFDPKTKEQIEKEKKEMQDPKFFIRRMNNETKEALDQLRKDYVPKKVEPIEDETADEINAAHYRWVCLCMLIIVSIYKLFIQLFLSQGHVAAGFTSTAMTPVTKQKAAVLTDDVVRFCMKAPKACENFITLCSRGYYNNTIFHRIIKNFMMQGGDPTGTGHGGESMWGKPFDDEFAPGLSHDARGILSMANKGTNTNQSQFFITFRPCKYLDKKHTIFGRVVGGQNTMISIEKVETDERDIPKEPVYFMRAEVFVNPFEEAEEEVRKERLDLLNKNAAKEAEAVKEPLAKPKVFSSGVGKYINPDNKRAAPSDALSPPLIKKKAVKSSLTDFSSW
ncbi:peptidyl-prolyl cis-trans isomerase, cyclophilin-type [Dictyocaulus viviparus]|uniref:RING-type E3 ubiquitin transferase n=1 Tax=Dictyocaulus viviparus TaxID=29172 RepID=A0A0D8XLV8_DICVI|nr:peptidyl-prolyl cis-trans isomerase, cyclophilin-type [Dictyocaulus viviparus]